MTIESTAHTELRRSAQRGFTLIESMIALLVLSVGLIGIAALHAQGLSASRTAIYRSTAINLSADMADRIRVNREASAAYGNAGADHDCDPNTGGTAVDCTPAEMAEHDLFVWEDLVGDSLPDGVGTVAVNTATDPATYTITVSWTEISEGQLDHVTTIQVPEF